MFYGVGTANHAVLYSGKQDHFIAGLCARLIYYNMSRLMGNMQFIEILPLSQHKYCFNIRMQENNGEDNAMPASSCTPVFSCTKPTLLAF